MRKDLSHLPPAPPVSPEAEANFRWVQANIEHLTEQYPNQWVAVVEQEVVAVGRTMKEAREAARARKGNRPCLVDFMEDGLYVYPQNTAGPLPVRTYLLPDDSAPLLIGMEDTLTECRLVCDFPNAAAYLEFPEAGE